MARILPVSERFNDCRNCAGSGTKYCSILLVEVECMLCGGTGFDGGTDITRMSFKKQSDVNRPNGMTAALRAFERGSK